jgi:hypothetical protein
VPVSPKNALPCGGEAIIYLTIMGIAIIDSLANSETEHFQVVPGAVRDQIAVNGSGRKLLLRPIFIESDSGERDVLCYVPQNLAANDNEPFTRMICELLGTGMAKSFRDWSGF